MYVQVTGETFREMIMDLFFVGKAVTFRALGDKPMPGMVTGCAIHLAMLAWGLLPSGENLGMARAAGDGRGIRIIGDLQRFVHRMTCCAG